MQGQDWIPVENTTEEVIPGGALMRVVAVTEDGIAQVAKPNADGQACLVNGPVAIPPTEDGFIGRGQGQYHARAIIAYDPVNGEPAPGEVWGAANNLWKARKNKDGFRIMGGAGNGLVNAMRTKTIEGDAGGGSLTVRSFTIPPNPVDDVTTLIVNATTGGTFDTGIRLTSPLANQAAITFNFATFSMGGLLSTQLQEIAGEKRFSGLVWGQSRVHVAGLGANGSIGLQSFSNFMGPTYANYFAPPNDGFSPFGATIPTPTFTSLYSTAAGVGAGSGGMLFYSSVRAVQRFNEPIYGKSVIVAFPIPNFQTSGSNGSGYYSGTLAVYGRFAVMEPLPNAYCNFHEGADSSGANTNGLMFKGGLYIGGTSGAVPAINGGSF